MNTVKVSLCQMTVGADKSINQQKAESMIRQAAVDGAEIIMLPEMFTCPYDVKCFAQYAEKVPNGDTGIMLSRIARELGIYLVGGSIPEIGGDGRLYNTCMVFDQFGKMVGKHRKIHLFDVKVRSGIAFQESATLSAGDAITVVDSPWGKLGIMICYDIRFPELARRMAEAGAQVIFVPAAFNLTTGPTHWELLFRSRALDNQVFLVGNSPARNHQAAYQAYGHSLIVDPWGRVLAEYGEQEGILTAELNLLRIAEVREAIPVWKQRREDVYKI